MKTPILDNDGSCCTVSSPKARSEKAETSASDRELAALAKAIGHPARVQILRFLSGRDSCMCGDIVEHLPLAQSTVSQHLKILKEVGLIRGSIDGPRICYCVEPKVLDRLKALVAGL
jgi:DNA-binding transcriptional ArsR family regulator